MNKLERIQNPVDTLRHAVDGVLSSLWTALPGIVQDFDPETHTATVQPAIKIKVSGSDGVQYEQELPLIVDVPVIFPNGGGFCITFPVKEGDECLLVFASRCIDGWWDKGGTQPQLENRKHALSDAFAIVGPKSRPNFLENKINEESAELRTDDGKLLLRLNSDHSMNLKNEKFSIDFEPDGKISVKASSVEAVIKGDSRITVNGAASLECEEIKLGKVGLEKLIKGESFMALFNTHVHTGNMGASTSPPQVPMTDAQLSSVVQSS